MPTDSPSNLALMSARRLTWARKTPEERRAATAKARAAYMNASPEEKAAINDRRSLTRSLSHRRRK